MSRAAPLLLGALLGAALVAPLVWLVADGGSEAGDDSARASELELVEARREVSDWERKWRAEWTRGEGARERIEQLERELAVAEGEIARLSAGGAATEDAGSMGGHEGTPEPTAAEDPTTWDEPRRRRELEVLAVDPSQVRRSPRLPLLVEAYRADPESGFRLFRDILSQPRMPTGYHVAVAAILEDLGDERGVDLLLETWEVERDDRARRAALRALSALPGDRQTARLLEELQVEPARPRLRMTAMHGLARRRHAYALDAARGTVEGLRAPLRARALQSLYEAAQDDGFRADDAALPVFEEGLASAQGPGQAKIALDALEGFGSPTSVTALRAYASNPEADVELAVRATELADRLSGGSE